MILLGGSLWKVSGDIHACFFHGYFMEFMPPEAGFSKNRASEGSDFRKPELPEAWNFQNPGIRVLGFSKIGASRKHVSPNDVR